MTAFASAIEHIKPVYQRMVQMEPFDLAPIPSSVPQQAGVYILSEDCRALYVGRTRDIRQRLRDHGSTQVTQATLAVKMARIAADRPATYAPGTGAKTLLREDPIFRTEFSKARRRIRAMQVRYVAEDDDVRQALLEIYAAVELGTILRGEPNAAYSGGYNSFRTS